MEKKLLCIRGASGCENTENSMIKNVGELFDKIVKFVHTYWDKHDIIITVKTPQYII